MADAVYEVPVDGTGEMDDPIHPRYYDMVDDDSSILEHYRGGTVYLAADETVDVFEDKHQDPESDVRKLGADEMHEYDSPEDTE